MTIAKVGAELLVNTTTTQIQADSDVAALAGGGFVVTWDDSSAMDEENYNYADIRAQIFSGSGARAGTEIAVNVETRDEQDNPGVVGLADGSFVVAFEDGSDATVGGTYITVRGFAANGSATTEDLQSSNETYYFTHPNPVLSNDGNLVVGHGAEDGGIVRNFKLQSGNSDILVDLHTVEYAEASGAYIENFANFGIPQGLAALSGNRFIQVYEGHQYSFDGVETSDEPLNGVLARLHAADGIPVGPTFQVNASLDDNASAPSVATLADGRFVITWSADGAGGSDVFARVYGADGASLTGPFVVNTVVAGSQGRSDVAALSDGGFVITWTDASGIGGDASGTAIKARTFDASGIGDPAEILVNTITVGSQVDPHAAGLPGDRFVISWTDAGAAGGADVKAQVFEGGQPSVDCPVVTRAGTQDGSAGSNDVLTGPAGPNTFLVQSAVSSGHDRIANFEKTDVFVTDAALRDANGDGFITFGAGGLFVDPTSSDRVSFTGLNPALGLRSLGESCEGVFVYADAAVRPKGAVEGTLGANALMGDAGDKTSQVFFFDTALTLDLGGDRITGFGAKDLLVTTTKIADSNNDGIIGFGADRILDLPNAAGTVTIDDKAVASLEFDGTLSHAGVLYFVYSQIGSHAGTDGLAFA